MKHTGFCQTLYFNENILKAAVCTYFTTLDITILILIPLHFKPLFPFTLLPVFPFQTQVKTCFSALIISWDSLQIAKFVHAWRTLNISFFSKEGDKPELYIFNRVQFTHSFESTSVVLEPHPERWLCPLWIWVISLYYPISGLYPKLFSHVPACMRFVCQGLGCGMGFQGWLLWGTTRSFPHVWCSQCQSAPR